MYKKIAILVALMFVSCTKNQDPVVVKEVGEYSSAITTGVSIDSFGWNFVAIGKTPASSRAVTLSTLGNDRVLVVIGEMQTGGVTETISDTAGLTWRPVGNWTQDESNVNEGFSTMYMWAALAPQQLTNDTITVSFNHTAGCAIGVLAAANAGMPVNFTHSSDPAAPAPQFTVTATAGSILFGGAIDVSGDCCLAWNAMPNTTMKAGDGYAANDYGVFWTTSPVAGGATTFGTTKAISGFIDWGAIAVEIPYTSVPVDGGTPPPPDAGTPDAGTPDAGTPDAGTCTLVCQ
jgi:hypothetical protein